MELRLTIPESYTDLTEKQLQFISSLFVLGLGERDFLLRAFLFLSRLRLYKEMKAPESSAWFVHPSINRPVLIDDQQLVYLSDRCRYLLTVDECIPPRMILGMRPRHYRLYDASFEEYLMAENYFFALQQTQKDEYLDCLIATLYRYPWEQWSSDAIQKRSRRFKKLRPEIKNLVLIWYIGFRTYLSRRCKTLFGGSNSTGGNFNPREYINSLIHQLSNGDITLKERILSTMAIDALDELEQRAIEFKNIQKK